jgi:hypothetical protein
VYLLTDFTNTSTHINVSLGTRDQTYFDISPAFFLGATIWSYTGTPQRQLLPGLAAAGQQPGHGRHCQRWQQVLPAAQQRQNLGFDRRGLLERLVSGLADAGRQHGHGRDCCRQRQPLPASQHREDLEVHRHGVQRDPLPGLDARRQHGHGAIADGGSQLYQLHNDASILRYTGTPCSGASCPGWQMLDDNPLTGMVVVGNNVYQLHTDPLYQLHSDGSLWRYFGTPCDGDFCPGWQMLDNHHATVAMAVTDSQFYQLHNDGSIWRHTGTPCSGASCPGWIELDNNPAAVATAATSKDLFQLHKDGSIWRHTGTPCSGSSCPGVADAR